MDCKLFDGIADHIIGSNYENEECIRRTSSGRYYYFVYHTVKAWLLQHHPDLIAGMGGSSHEKLRFCMEHLSVDKANRKFGMLALKLNQMHRIRVHADYTLDNEFTSSQVTMLQKERDRVCELLKELENI